jgi:small-conductance mechanosensitive channel
MSESATSPGSIEQKIVLTLVLIAALIVVGTVLRAVAGKTLGQQEGDKPRFWTFQAISLGTLVAIVIALAVVWAPLLGNFGSALGLIGAGFAVALQRVVTSFAGYLIILRGKIFTVGDRITIGSVRGDVVALGFMQTTILEMGQSPPEQSAPPAVWVRGRQYTGRIVRVTNDKIFDSPVFNYTREFPFVWDEIMIPIHHDADRGSAENILLKVARARTGDVVNEARSCLADFRHTYYLKGEIELDPRVYIAVNDNWIEMSLRFLAPEPGVRTMKDALYRDILGEFHSARIAFASTSSEMSIVRPVELRVEPAH